MRRWLAALICLSVSSLQADPRIPLPDTAFESGVFSSETLGRGGTMASNHDSPASGSENPAALAGADKRNSLYTTVLINTSSSLPIETVRDVDPLSGKVLQYLSIKAERGVFFFEPLSRQQTRVQRDAGEISDIDFNLNALGVAGGDKFKKTGGFGLSIAYLWGSAAETRYTTGAPNQSVLDTGDGVRMNLGFRYPMGSTMWGLVVQNAPGFVWWKNHTRTLLPVRVRAGNTWRIQPGLLFSIDGEHRFNQEGGDPKDLLYIGNEMYLWGRLALRAGVFAENINRPESRHWTGGLTIKDLGAAELSYAIEIFTLASESVKRSFISLNWPFTISDSDK